ncbi:dirigent protein 16-like [Carica papaya]|uniref:dirigent protein 16-like n=1 Tax=Carica papaya TaxID=3649 RepID=UPI000B8C9AF8|nr:dirigent protein 16-like [Carica papaya]
MAKLPPIVVLFLFVIVDQSFSLRILNNHHYRHRKITFIMQNVFNVSEPSSKSVTTKVAGHHLPFLKPLGFFPPKGGIPIPESLPTSSTIGESSQAVDISDIGLNFPARATLEELELGTFTSIDEDLFKISTNGGKKLFGKAHGVYVASPGNGTGYMMAVTAFLGPGEFPDGLRLFGVYRAQEAESHVAVIGGTGKYNCANGYASVKAFELQGANKLLLFTVYLSL